MGLLMLTLGLAGTYAITTFGPKLSIQNKIKAIRSKMKTLMLVHNNQIIA